MERSAKIAIAVVFVALAIFAAFAFWRWRSSSFVVLHVPHASQAPVIDGDVDDKAWLDQPGRTGVFLEAGGAPATPHAEARFIWAEGLLDVALFAVDTDIRSSRAPADGPRGADGDSFELIFRSPTGEYRLEVSPDGKLTDSHDGNTSWQSGAKVGHKADGTLDDPTDDDARWVLEMEIPLRALGIDPRSGARLDLSIRRCDAVKTGPRTCVTWTGHLQLD